MNSETIMKSDVLDILFENRNKAYGAYNLRKFYSNRLVKSLGIMLGSVLVLSAFTFLPDKKVEKPDDVLYTVLTTLKTDEPKKDPEPKKDIVKPRTTQAKPTQTVIWTSPVIVPSTVPVTTLTAAVDTVAIGTTTVSAPGSGPKVITPDDPGDGGGPGPVGPVVTVNKNIPLSENEVDVMPSFPGGMPALIKYLQRNLTNPRDLEEGEIVSVKVKFIVGYDGKLKDLNIIKDGGEEFNKEVLRVVKKMPDWIPGKAKGEEVSVYYTIPVKFITTD